MGTNTVWRGPVCEERKEKRGEKKNMGDVDIFENFSPKQALTTVLDRNSHDRGILKSFQAFGWHLKAHVVRDGNFQLHVHCDGTEQVYYLEVHSGRRQSVGWGRTRCGEGPVYEGTKDKRGEKKNMGNVDISKIFSLQNRP